MRIVFKGTTFFQITGSSNKVPRPDFYNNKGQKITILIDPALKGAKKTLPESDIALLTQQISGAGSKKNAPFIIDQPGEYDVKGVLVHAIPAGQGLIFSLEAEDIRICHVGCLKQKELATEQIEKIGPVDILMLSLDQDNSISQALTNQLEPAIVIPMCCAANSKAGKCSGVDKFLKTMGESKPAEEEALIIKKKDLPKEGANIVILKPV